MKRYLSVIFALGAVLTVVAWWQFEDIRQRYWLIGEPFDYWPRMRLFYDHWNTIFFVVGLVFVVLAFASMWWNIYQRWLPILTVTIVVVSFCGCAFTILGLMLSNHTTFWHMEQESFGDYEYFLAHKRDRYWDPAVEYQLFALYRCEKGGKNCHTQYSIGDGWGTYDSIDSLEVASLDQQSGAILMTVDESTVYIVGQIEREFKLPHSDVISADNVASLSQQNTLCGDGPAIAWSPDGSWLASGNGPVWLHHLEDAHVITQNISDIDVYVDHLSFGTGTLAIIPSDGAIRDLDLETMELTEIAETSYSREATYHPILELTARVHREQILVGNELMVEHPNHLDIYTLQFSSNGDFLVAAGSDREREDEGFVRVWNLDIAEETLMIHLPESFGIWDIYVGDRYLGFTTRPRDFGQNQLQIWDMETRQKILDTGLGYGSMAFHPELPMVAVNRYDGVVEFWDLEVSEIIHSLPVEHVVRGMVFRPDGRVLAMADDSGHVRLWTVD